MPINNQNQLSSLDPKLAERFHAVMNTPTPSSSGANPSPFTTSMPTTNPVSSSSPIPSANQPLPMPPSPTMPASEPMTIPAPIQAAPIPTTVPSPVSPVNTTTPQSSPTASFNANPTPVNTPSSSIPTTPTPLTPNEPAYSSHQINSSALPHMPQMEQKNEEHKTEIMSTALPEIQTQSAFSSQLYTEKKKGGKISPVIIVLGTIIFLLIYTYVWTKVFNLSLPFLP